MPAKIKDILCQKYGRLTVLEEIIKIGKGRRFRVVCDCGNTKDVELTHLRMGFIVSCGCFNKEQTSKAKGTHRMSGNKLYSIWANMIQRCINPNTINYKGYGGRGITICNEWKNSFENFLNWAQKNNYNHNLEIDRINNDGNYCPENCRFVTRTQNARNRTVTHYIVYKGEKKSLAEWSEQLGIRQSILLDRLNKLKWSINKAIETPVLNNKTRLLYK